MDILVSNSKDIVEHLLSLENKYGWVQLSLMVTTAAGNKINFLKVEKISLKDIKTQVWGYFGLVGIVHVTQSNTNPLVA